MWGIERKWLNTRLSSVEIATALRLGRELDQGLHTCLALVPALLNQIDLSCLTTREALLLIELHRDFHPEQLTKERILEYTTELLRDKADSQKTWGVDGRALAHKMEQMTEAQALALHSMGLCYQYHPPEGEGEIALFLQYWLSPPAERRTNGIDNDFWQIKP